MPKPDIPNYIEDKADGKVSVINVDDFAFYARKKYDEDTGQQKASELVALEKQSLIIEKARLTSEITAIDAVIADIDQVLPEKSGESEEIRTP